MVDTPHSGVAHFELNGNPEVPINAAFDDLDEGLNGYHIETISADHDFTADLDADGDSVWHRARTIEIDGTLTGAAVITVPNAETKKLVWNNTSGGFAIGIEANAGSPSMAVVDIPAGAKVELSIDPSGNVYSAYAGMGIASACFDFGSAAAPSITFAGDKDTGMFRADTNELGFSTGAAEAMRIDASRNVGMLAGNMVIDPSGALTAGGGDGTLHVHTCTAGAVAALASASDLVVEAAADVGFSTLAPDANVHRWVAGGPADSDFGTLAWNYNSGAPRLAIENSGAERFRFTLGSAPVLFVNETANANMTSGLTINMGAADDQILAFKSSDVATGLTTSPAIDVETDDFMTIGKASGAQGGVFLQALAEDGAAPNILSFRAHGGTADTNKTTSARALVEVYAAEHDGANGNADITADGNVFAVRALVGAANVARFLIDEDGDMWSVTAGGTFDAWDDGALISSYDRIRSGFAGFTRYNEGELIAAGILGGPVSEGGMTNVAQLQRALTGAAVQQSAQHRILVDLLGEERPALLAKYRARLDDAGMGHVGLLN